MTDRATKPGTNAKLVVLATADTIGGNAGRRLLCDTIIHVGPTAALLILVSESLEIDLALACNEHLAGSPIRLQVLLGPDVTGDTATLPATRMPAVTKAQERHDATEFALALSDVLWAHPATHTDKLVRRAKELGKPIVAPGHGLPVLPQAQTVTHGLDPETLGKRTWRRDCFGRLEQALIEGLAFDWFATEDGGFARSWERLKRCFRGSWYAPAYFAPPCCSPLAPDQAAMAPSSALVTPFEALDRSAVYGAYYHRDVAWVTHLGAALAVFAAVVGVTTDAIIAFACVEFVLLVIIAGLMFRVRCNRLQDRWTSCRLGAEQLRIARMCLPLRVVPPALASEDIWPDQPHHDNQPPDLTLRALAEVKRAVRDYGLPQLDAQAPPEQAAAWLECIVQDQIAYHKRNHRKLHMVENRVQAITSILFCSAIIAVIAEVVVGMWPCLHAGWLLLVTAGFPAFAAAFHGAATRLGIVQRIALSHDVERTLARVHDSVSELMRRPDPAGADALTDIHLRWSQVRSLAFQAAEAMGQENKSWHSQVRLQRDSLPA